MIFLFLFFCILSGAAGALAMSAAMRAISRLGGGDEVDMLQALGSFFTGKKESATRNGVLIHLWSGTAFGLVYGLLFAATGLTSLPQVFLLGLGFGFLHGLGMAYVLMIYMAEKHPLEEYRNVSLIIGAIHLVGHIVYGGVVGLIAGIGTLIARASGLN